LGEPVGLDQFLATDPTPEFAGQVADTCSELLGCLNEQLRTIAQLKMEGYTHAEIAEKLDISTRAVTRKLDVIRRKWSEEDRD
jgi:DNA-directed RNA polymerase specialized sigma24 family protein